MAMDAQGGAKARPYVDRVNPSFVTVVDEENLLGQLYGFKAIPNGLLVDDAGILRYKKFGGFDVRTPETARIVHNWAEGLSSKELAGMAEEVAIGPEHMEAISHFRQGLAMYRGGRVKEALSEWRRGVELAPDNYVIRKQIWAVEHPERFYHGKVDYDWQREQIEQGL